MAWGDALADAGCWASGEVCIEADSAKFVHRSARAMARQIVKGSMKAAITSGTLRRSSASSGSSATSGWRPTSLMQRPEVMSWPNVDVIDAQIVSDSMKARGRQPSPEMQRHLWLATDAVDAVAWGGALAERASSGLYMRAKGTQPSPEIKRHLCLATDAIDAAA